MRIDFIVRSRSRLGRRYPMVRTPEGIAVHMGEGCDGEPFNGPTGCWHSREGSLMTQALVKAEAVLTPAPVSFNQEQLQVIKDTICKGATDAELQLFVATCVRTGLDPFMRQIHPVKRWDNNLKREVMGIQVGIDGLRLVAERTGKYAGQDPIEWLDVNGTWSEVWTGEGDHPIAARCSVYRKDWPGRKATAVCRWDSYAQTYGNPPKLGPTWAKMPDVMLGKCAEALALRRAFPAEMSGLAAAVGGDNYSPEIDIELGQTSIEDAMRAAMPEAIEGTYRDTTGANPAGRSNGAQRQAEGPGVVGRAAPAATPAAAPPDVLRLPAVVEWLDVLQERKGRQARDLTAKKIREAGDDEARAITRIKMVAGIRDQPPPPGFGQAPIVKPGKQPAEEHEHELTYTPDGEPVCAICGVPMQEGA
jgi:phage recombination protein Bet